MAQRRDPEYIGQTDEYGNPIITTQGTGLTGGGGLGAPGTTGAQGTYDPLGAPGSTGAAPTDPSGQGQLRRPGVGHTGIATTEGYGTYETTGLTTGGGPTTGTGHYDTGGLGTGTTGYGTGGLGTTAGSRGTTTGYDTGGLGTTTTGSHGFDTGGMGPTAGSHCTTTGYDTGELGTTTTGSHGFDTGGGLGMGTTGGHETGTYDRGGGHVRGPGTAQDVTGGQTRVGLHRDTDREKKGITEKILEHLPGTGRKST